MGAYRILVRTMGHANVENFSWHKARREADALMVTPPSCAVWETDDKDAALLEYSELLKSHSADSLTLARTVDVEVTARERAIRPADPHGDGGEAEDDGDGAPSADGADDPDLAPFRES